MSNLKSLINFSDLSALNYSLGEEMFYVYIRGEKIDFEKNKDILFRTERFFDDSGLSYNHETLSFLMTHFATEELFNMSRVVQWVDKKDILKFTTLHQYLIKKPSRTLLRGEFFGFIHPDGTIKNVQYYGSSPNGSTWRENFLKKLYSDFLMLANAFPNLSLQATVLKFHEHKSLIEFYVEKGQVRVDFGDQKIIDIDSEIESIPKVKEYEIHNVKTAIDPEWIKKWFI